MKDIADGIAVSPGSMLPFLFPLKQLAIAMPQLSKKFNESRITIATFQF
jgi:hypothetical protein